MIVVLIILFILFVIFKHHHKKNNTTGKHPRRIEDLVPQDIEESKIKQVTQIKKVKPKKIRYKKVRYKQIRHKKRNYNSKWWVNYRKYLKSEHWKDFRKEQIKKANHHCQRCKKYSEHLDVHHLNYKHLGHERDKDVIVLCHACHQKVHHRKF